MDALARDRRRSGHGAELLMAAGVGLLLAMLTSWPLALHLGSVIPHDDGDPLLQAWQIAWIGHAWLHQPLHLFQANTFWPLADSLAFSDAPMGYTPAALIAQRSPHTAVVVYNLLFVFAYTLAFFGAYVLARVLRLGRTGALVTGVAFAYAPWRLAQDGHLHVISSGGIPLALALLIHGYRRGSAWTALAGWLVATWQVSLGFSLGLQLASVLVVLAVIAAALGRREALRRLDRPLVVATVVGAATFCLVALALARPYLRVVDAHPEARRSLTDVFRFSPPLSGFLATPSANLLWGTVTARARAGLPFPDEATLFPGLAIVALAALGVRARTLPRRLRVGLVVGILTCAVLSIGLRHTQLGYVTPYRLLYELPGWDGIRTPGRLNTLTSLGLALLAGAGATAVVAAVRRRGLAHASLVTCTILAAAIVVEGRGPIAHPAVPPVPAGQRGAPAPVLHLPSDSLHDLRYTYWSTAGFGPMANGSSGFEPVALARLRADVRGFPDAESVAALRAYGVRSVVLHPELAAGSPWQGADRRPLNGLPLTRERRGTVVVYRLTASSGR